MIFKYFQSQTWYKKFYKNGIPVDKNMKLNTYNHTTLLQFYVTFELHRIRYKIFYYLILRFPDFDSPCTFFLRTQNLVDLWTQNFWFHMLVFLHLLYKGIQFANLECGRSALIVFLKYTKRWWCNSYQRI